MVFHASEHLNERTQFIITKNTSKTSQTHLQFEPDFVYIDDEMLHLAFGALEDVRYLNKSKNVIRLTTRHIESQLLSTFGDFFPSEEVQLCACVNSGLLRGTRLQFCIVCHFSLHTMFFRYEVRMDLH